MCREVQYIHYHIYQKTREEIQKKKIQKQINMCERRRKGMEKVIHQAIKEKVYTVCLLDLPT